MTTATGVRERPILFSGPMVCAILDGRKTQTRRVMKPQPPEGWSPIACERYHPCLSNRDGMGVGPEIFGAYNEDWGIKCPHGGPGDRLWVRESFNDFCPIWDGYWCGHGTTEGIIKDHLIAYKATNTGFKYVTKSGELHENVLPKKWKPAIHMRREWSRLTLDLTDVRVERLQDISEDDARREGVPDSLMASTYKIGFENLWNSIHGCNAHKLNPWVWVVSFRKVESP